MSRSTYAGRTSLSQVNEEGVIGEDTEDIQVVPVQKESLEGQPYSSGDSIKRRRSKGSRLFRRESCLIDEEKNPEWIPSNIIIRECNHYVARLPPAENDDPNDPSCQCGNKRSSHQKRYINDQIQTTEWKAESHTQITQTDAYGEIEFVGAAIGSYGTLKQKRYVRLDHMTHPNKVLTILRDHWNLRVPKLLISVTGGALNFHMNSRLREVFKGLIKAALSTGAWIITGGTHAGVMKYVGDAVRDYALASGTTNQNNVVAIGIASWGVIDQKENLIKDENNPDAPSIYRMDIPGEVKLDPNHTHFLLVDNGTAGQFGVEIKLRAKIEKAISEQKIDGGSDKDVSVPTVCVVVEGGPNTIYTVHQAVMNGTPAVIVAGSGRAANILAFAAQRATEVEFKDNNGSKEKKMFIGEHLRVKLAERIKKEFGEKDLDTHLTRIQECVEKSDLFNVYDMDASIGIKNIDEAILHALLRANKGSVQDQLKLTLVWNRIDIAKSELFSDDRDWKKGELDAALHYCLVHNQVDFVKLFLENGVSLKDYLTVRELTLLYNEVKEKTLIYKCLEKQRGPKNPRKKFNLGDVGKLLVEMTMDSYEPLYLQAENRYVLTEADIISEPIVRDVAENDEADTGAFESMEPHALSTGIAQATNVFIPYAQNSGGLNTFDNPIRELLIWSVLQGRKEMSQFFCEECKEKISAALTSCMILRSMSKKEDDPNHKEQLSDWFEDFAIGVLNECYNEDEERTSVILLRELDQWGKATCLSLAVNGKMKKFVSQQGVQNLLNEIWMGKLSKENSKYILALCFICPLLICSLIKFREDENDDEKENNVVRISSSKRKKSIKADGNTSEGDQLNESFPMVKTQDPVSNGAQNNSTIPNGRVRAAISFMLQAAGGNSGKKLSRFQRFKLFYDSPIITFIHNLLFYFLFLGLFSYIMLTDFNPKVSVAEYVLVGWMITLFTEEFRQIAQGESYRWQLRITFWITDYWNIVDLASLILFSVGFVMRLYNETFSESRVILSIDLMIFYVRLLQVFSINKNLGPKLIMISKMMVDLAFFLCILFVFLVAYGVASQAIMFPNTSGFLPVFKGIFYKSYFQMYGELFLEDIQVEDGSCTDTGGIYVGDIEDPCPEFTLVAICLLSGYMLFSNVLLLNLLIAMFSNTFSTVQGNTDQYWKFQCYEIISEYVNRPRLAPPFIAISHIYLLVTYILRKFCSCSRRIDSPSGALKQQVPESEVKHLALWESFNGETYMAGERQKQQQDTNERVRSLVEKVECAPQQTVLGGNDLNARIDGLEDQMDRINMALDWVIKSHIENGMGCESGAPKLKEIAYKENVDDFIPDKEEVYKVPTTLEAIGIMIHKKARQSPYPGTAIRRSYVPDSKVPWEVDFPQYAPKEYTHKSVLSMPHWADLDLMAMSKDKRPMMHFNNEDPTCKVDRRSWVQNYDVKDGLPLNPKGRTGMIGRGLLGRFGPNHAADPIVTRWKMNADGTPMLDGNLKVLEFIAIQRKDNQQWAIPGGMVEPGQVVGETLKREFSEEALGQMAKTPEEKAAIADNIEKLFENGIEIYRGYVDDPRNTDNAWMETVAMNFHDESGSAFGQFELKAGDDAQSVRWQRVSSRIPLFASHTAMLRKVAEKHNAAF